MRFGRLALGLVYDVILVFRHLHQQREGLKDTSVLREAPIGIGPQQDSNLVGLEVRVEQQHARLEQFEVVHYGIAVWPWGKVDVVGRVGK